MYSKNQSRSVVDEKERPTLNIGSDDGTLQFLSLPKLTEDPSNLYMKTDNLCMQSNDQSDFQSSGVNNDFEEKCPSLSEYVRKEEEPGAEDKSLAVSSTKKDTPNLIEIRATPQSTDTSVDQDQNDRNEDVDSVDELEQNDNMARQFHSGFNNWNFLGRGRGPKVYRYDLKSVNKEDSYDQSYYPPAPPFHPANFPDSFPFGGPHVPPPPPYRGGFWNSPNDRDRRHRGGSRFSGPVHPGFNPMFNNCGPVPWNHFESSSDHMFQGFNRRSYPQTMEHLLKLSKISTFAGEFLLKIDRKWTYEPSKSAIEQCEIDESVLSNSTYYARGYGPFQNLALELHQVYLEKKQTKKMLQDKYNLRERVATVPEVRFPGFIVRLCEDFIIALAQVWINNPMNIILS